MPLPRFSAPHLAFAGLFSLLGLSSLVHADAPPLPTLEPHVMADRWNAGWIAPAGIEPSGYGVYHFRKSFDLGAQPAAFVVHVSADNRYRLFVNGTPVHVGPARGDRTHWRFDTLDLAPHLHAGPNVIAAQVWNFGAERPVAQVTVQTAFVLAGNGPLETVVDTDGSWRAIANPAYSPIGNMGGRLRTYIVVGPGDDVDGARYPWAWEQPDYDDSTWPAANRIANAEPRGTSTDGRWLLVPREIPLMESAPIRWARVRRAEGVAVPDDFLAGGAPLTVPAHTRATVLLDQAVHTTGWPELVTRGGAGSAVQLTYAESLYEGPAAAFGSVKGDRDEIDGKHLRGFSDTFRPDGGAGRVFRPLRWRTWRYVEVAITTDDEPLVIEDLRAEFTAYPFVENASFASDDPELGRIWDIAWRTLRTGSHDVFADSPYYEQLSYVGDTRIEALVSLYVSGDDRLMRKSILAFDESRNPNGLTSSRWPDSRHQIIPPYSLVWISMVHDYWRMRDDPAFVAARLPGVREVLRYFAEHSDPDTGSYTARQWWNFVDWIPSWGSDQVTRLGGVPPRDAHGNSAILNLQYVHTLQQAAELFAAFDQPLEAARCTALAQRLRRYVIETCWNAESGLVADKSDQGTFSQHANALLILTDTGDRTIDPGAVAEKLLHDPSLTPATFYFSFYVHQALVQAGFGEAYLEQLAPWRGVLAQGLTTVPETPAPDSRSDSHAWGAHPLHGLLAYVCGVEPAEPGFKSVRIAPHLGALTHVEADVPHPAGAIRVALRRNGRDGLATDIFLPGELHGELVWRGVSRPLKPGANQVSLHVPPAID